MARKVGLTTTEVLDAAAELADEQGLDAVTLASVAARLGVRPPSLYSYVNGLDGLRRQLALHAAAQLADALRTAADGRTGLAALEAIAPAYRGFAMRHAGWYAAAHALRPGEDDELDAALAAAVAPTLRALREAGAPPHEQVHLARAYRAALHGFVTLEQVGGFGTPEPVDDSFTRFVALLLAGVKVGYTPPR